MNLDPIDISILKELQVEARISNIELADRVGLSPSACSRRLDQLEKSGTIQGYQAIISNEVLGQTVNAIIHITLDGQSKAHLADFEAAAHACPYIVACFLMSGEFDYLVRINARDMIEFEEIHKNWLSTMPGVVRIQSSFAMRTVVTRSNIDVSVLQKS
ncbi:MAG: Lrp/AsnC family transcriptional regulator [Rhizobiaceae bacterium]|nr:Lrp/AsnC family transcriptional regulator [Rhizobiaceae bacterium]